MASTPTSDNGMVTIGMMVDLRLPRNRKITTMTMIAASPSVFITSQIEARMKLVAS